MAVPLSSPLLVLFAYAALSLTAVMNWPHVEAAPRQDHNTGLYVWVSQRSSQAQPGFPRLFTYLSGQCGPQTQSELEAKSILRTQLYAVCET
jgi:hypothetical protein